MFFKHPTFSMFFQKTHFPIRVLKIKLKLSNLTSNFQTHNKVGHKLWTCLYIGIYITYIPTKYKKIWRTLLIFRPIHPSIHQSIPSVNSALRASSCKLPWTPKGHCRCLLDIKNGWIQKKKYEEFWRTLLIYILRSHCVRSAFALRSHCICSTFALSYNKTPHQNSNFMPPPAQKMN